MLEVVGVFGGFFIGQFGSRQLLRRFDERRARKTAEAVKRAEEEAQTLVDDIRALNEPLQGPR